MEELIENAVAAYRAQLEARVNERRNNDPRVCSREDWDKLIETVELTCGAFGEAEKKLWDAVADERRGRAKAGA